MKHAKCAAFALGTALLLGPATAVPQAKTLEAPKAAAAHTDKETAKLKSELKKLRADKESACKANARSADCIAKTGQFDKARATYETRIDSLKNADAYGSNGDITKTSKPRGTLTSDPIRKPGWSQKPAPGGTPTTDPLPPPPPPRATGDGK